MSRRRCKLSSRMIPCTEGDAFIPPRANSWSPWPRVATPEPSQGWPICLHMHSCMRNVEIKTWTFTPGLSRLNVLGYLRRRPEALNRPGLCNINALFYVVNHIFGSVEVVWGVVVLPLAWCSLWHGPPLCGRPSGLRMPLYGSVSSLSRISMPAGPRAALGRL